MRPESDTQGQLTSFTSGSRSPASLAATTYDTSDEEHAWFAFRITFNNAFLYTNYF